MSPSRKVAIVTGGSRGIGAGIVRALVRTDYDVRFTFRTSDEQARQLEGELGGRCRGRAVDGADPAAVAGYVAEIEAEGPVALLVNNAGVSHDSLVDRIEDDHVREVFGSSLYSAINFSRAVIPLMRRARHGDVVNISSLASANVRPGNAVYGAAKAALERFSLSLALECARSNVAVNVVAPGFVETEMTKAVLTDEARRELLQRIPLRRLTTVEDVADAVLMLTSRRPLFIGAILPVGGGGQLIT
jgi:3-oxoacyl-[acyl-carrier protein] reductase